MDPNIRLVRLPLASRYAIQGMLQLARRPGQDYLLLADIAKGGRLPKDFLSKIFQDLARAGLLESRKGRGGGWALARPAGKIRLMEIIEAIQEPFPEQAQCVLGHGECSSQSPCLLHEAVVGWEKLMKKRLSRTTLEQAAYKFGL